ncbi:Alpha-ketoglutarate-dependent dioxygenase alkB-like 7, mitochondrial [Hondaea fermentalgiana]|uniref:Alpha-ketoglutarate-dependent dioxygenase alkB-like 7, mitochondrial n=1 Tax=Hondaea fermentalgiana TaxID=2315210 RepID=A0A2R5GP76_9STRA|nr:Alpha-ketoglutarate-dependent dioxygenase alkB-like 7, mitochondrial [Hondaea fermentalgiana]|eukprot:GBG32680.1 Alpha-ketoglutarate-dependent dioxygenase alkB-like 7, mitochondrial [Hondaea fermentalgiana]
MLGATRVFARARGRQCGLALRRASSAPAVPGSSLQADPKFVDASRGEGLEIGAADAVVFPDAISQEEHDALVEEILHGASDRAMRKFRKRKYQEDHWDAVIVGYKEIERAMPLWPPALASVLQRMQDFVQRYLEEHVERVNGPLEYLPPHIIDLAADGEIRPHVDSIKFSGEVVAGLSLLSTRTMSLRKGRDDPHAYTKDEPAVDLLLPPRSLYILCNRARFDMGHSVERVDPPERRFSIIFRDAIPIDKENDPSSFLSRHIV